MSGSRSEVRAVAQGSVAVALACAITYVLACGGAGEGPTGPGGNGIGNGNTSNGAGSGVVTAPPGPTVTVSLGTDVAPAATNAIIAVVTVGDSVTAPKGVATRAFGVAVDSGTVPVLALDANGNPMAAAFAPVSTSASTPVSLTATSTAVVLARVLIPTFEVVGTDEATLRQLVAARPEFPALVDSVRAAMARGSSYATSASVVAEAAIVAAGVTNALPTPSGSRVAGQATLKPVVEPAHEAAVPVHSTVPLRGRAVTTARTRVGPHATVTPAVPAFRTYPIAMSLSGGSTGTLTFANSSYAIFGFVVAPQPGTNDELPGETFCPFCLPPSFGIQPAVRSYPAPSTTGGTYTATASFGAAGRSATELQLVVDATAGIFRIVGIAVPEDQLQPLVGAATTGIIDFAGASAQANWHDAAQVVLSGLVTSLPHIGIALLPQLPRFAGRAATFGFLRALALPLAVFDNATWALGRLQYYADATQYWSTPPESVQFCIASDGTLSTACVTAVSVNFSSPGFAVGQSVQATAIATDAAGDTLTGLRVQWALIAGPGSVSSSGVVTATDSGTITVRATMANVPGTGNVVASRNAVLTVAISPHSATVDSGATTSFTAVVDSAGHVVTGHPVSWASADTHIATVSAAGVVTALKPGQTSLVASSPGVRPDTAILLVPGRYITDMYPAIPPSPHTRVTGIDSSGRVVGILDISTAFTWTPAGGLRTAPGQEFDGVSPSGNIVGYDFGLGIYYVQSPTGSRIATFSPSFEADAVNDSGNVAGRCFAQNTVCLWTPATGLVTVPLPVTDFNNTYVAGINRHSAIAGAYSDSLHHAFLWNRQQGLLLIGGLPGGNGDNFARGVNDNGMVVGEARTAANLLHAFVWTAQAGIQDIGTLGGQQSVAYAVNNHGQVVGWSNVADGSVHAFVWQSGSGMQDLGTLPGPSGATYAQAIDDAGDIAGVTQGPSGGWHLVAWTSRLPAAPSGNRAPPHVRRVNR